MTREALLEIEDFSLDFDTFDGVYKALDKVNLTVHEGEALGIVGETGCGKSVTAKSITRLVPSPPARVRSGRIVFQGTDLLTVTEQQIRAIRGIDIAMIFQDPMTYLNPVFTVGQQMIDVIRAHERFKPAHQRRTRAEVRAVAVEMLAKVHLPNPERQLDTYPHQLSGGMRQRVLIAQALSGRPALLIADEPTTALDVTIQAQILDLIGELMDELDLSVILITHDLGVVATLCDRIAVMYAGQVVEDATVVELFDAPRHPYTRGLLAAVPQPDQAAIALQGIPGSLPNLLEAQPGCRFNARCEHAMPACERRPPAVSISDTHVVSCWLYTEHADA